MREVELPKWIRLAGRAARYLTLAAVAMVLILPHLGWSEPGPGHEYELVLSRQHVYVNVLEYIGLNGTFAAAFGLGSLFVAAYFMAYFSDRER